MPSNNFKLVLDPSSCSLINDKGEVTLIPIGPISLAEQQFKNKIPSHLEIESAIESIEDLIMPLDKDLQKNRSLLMVSSNVTDLDLQDISNKQHILSIEQFEDVFNKALFDKASKNIIAALLIIRECLHHLRFTQLIFE